MHHDNIEALRQEAVRITQLEINILQEIIKQDILSEPSPESKVKQTFDTVSAPKTIEVLEGEQHKLQNLDMVLAIVGTMKAGKSTTINAIVGTEILPNRNAPMTAIPTLIRHTKGQIEPKLVFDNYQPLNDLMQILHQQIVKLNYAEAIEKLKDSDRDLYSLAQKIRHQEPINYKAMGAAAIFEFLKSVNDLVRIAPLLGIDFPFTDYDEIHELPVIEIEFTHLKEMESGKGRLILLDTPGPNEAGQQHLRPMLQDQLKKASAVLAVMDYTQLKSQADKDIRDELSGIAETAKGRIYALVNKFDQRDYNSMNEKDVKAFVAGLIEHQIKEEQIFPVSSKLAFLSNRARHALQIHGKLPSPQDEPWVNDFIDMANLDEDGYEDIDEIREAIDKFWKKSKFSNPIEDVIKVAFDNAALLALKSTSAKAYETADNINKFLYTKETALSKTIKELQKLVDEVQIDIQNVCQCEADAKVVINKSIIAIHEEIKSIMATFEGRNKLKFDDYFKNGVIKQKELAESFEKQLKSQSISSALGLLFREIALKEIGSSKHPQEVKIPSDGVISFSNNKDEAERFTNSIQNWINSEINQTKLDIESILEQKLKEFGASYQSNIITPSQETLNGLKKTLATAGFTSLNLELPSSSVLKLDINVADLTSDAIQQESHSRTRYRDSDNFGSGAKRFFGGVFGKDDWGRDSYEVVEHEYKVDFNKMKQSTNHRLTMFFASIGNNIQHNIGKPIEESSNDFFTAFKKIVEHIRADLIQSLNDKELDQRSQDELLNKLIKIKQQVPSLIQDTKALKKSLTAS